MSTPARSAYVISAQEIAPGWVLLYAVTFLLQFVCGLIRGIVLYPVLWVIFTILGWSTSPVNALLLVIAYGPLVLSLATLILPVGGWLWQ